MANAFNRGQSAMEFLMTYGWAILVLTIVLAVLFYIGVLNPKNIQTNVQFFAPGAAAYSFGVANSTGALALDFGQALGRTIIVTGISCSENSSAMLHGLNNPITIPSGEHRLVAGGNSNNGINCTGEDDQPLAPDDAQLGERYTGTICVAYTEADSGANRTVCGTLGGTFQNLMTGEGEGGETPTPEPTGSETATPTPTPTETPIGPELSTCGTITQPGNYTISADFNSSTPVSCNGHDACICIQSEGVTFDCQQNGMQLQSSWYGPAVSVHSSSVEVKNCNIRNFYYGISAVGSNISITGNTVGGGNGHCIDADVDDSNIAQNQLDSCYVAMQLTGTNDDFTGNTIANTTIPLYIYTNDSRFTSNDFNVLGEGQDPPRPPFGNGQSSIYGAGNTFSGNAFSNLACMGGSSQCPECNVDDGTNTCAHPSAFCHWAQGTCAAPSEVCGDFRCNWGENSENCCLDCGCPAGQNCMDNTCNTNTTLTACTYINTSGTYTLSPDFHHTIEPYCGGNGDACICANAPGITIDCGNNLMDVHGGDGISVNNDGAGTTIRNCNITDFDNYAVATYSAITVTGNTFTNGGTGFAGSGTGAGRISDNTMSDLAHGIRLMYINGFVIENNTMSSIRGKGIEVYRSSGDTFRNNDVLDSGELGFYCYQGGNNFDTGGNLCNNQSGCSLSGGGWLYSCPPGEPSPTPSPTPWLGCNMNGLCDESENCTCYDCYNQEDGCTWGQVCDPQGSGACVAASCDNDMVCDSGEGCGCMDCEGMRDGCPEGYICSYHKSGCVPA